jgi:hypothetical protein
VPWIPVAAATATLPWIVPENPLLHLDDPSHWGLIGYVATLLLLLRRSGRGVPRRTLALFLAGMPLIYLANWLRHDGSPSWLAVELFGIALFGALAWIGLFRAGWWLAVGVAAHGIWDIAHVGAAPFVPDWYATACAIVDVAMGGYVATVCLVAEAQDELRRL